MSMAKCKCDRIFDTDDELGFDAQGNLCCEECDYEMYMQFIKDLKKIGYNEIVAENLADKLMNMNYRKVK